METDANYGPPNEEEPDFEDAQYDEDDGDIGEPPVFTPAQLPARTELINSSVVIANIQAQDEILKSLVDYVNTKLIPGKDYFAVTAGQLPSLGKPGAEKVNFIFRLVPKYKILAKTFKATEITYEIECNLINKVTGEFAGSGVGGCTSLEDKWAFMWKFDKDVPKSIDIDDLEYKEFWSKNMNNGQGGYYKKYRIPIDNHFNIANTILKMAKKRAYVDATLSATMASFLFTQDIEERMDEYLIGAKKNNATPKKTMPSNSSNKAPNRPVEPRKPATPAKTLPAPKETSEVEKPSSVYVQQELNYMTFKIVNSKSTYYNKVLVDCPSWYLQGQIDWINEGKFDPSKYGYDTRAYLDMYQEAIEFRKEHHQEEEN